MERFELAWEPTAEDWAEGFSAYRRSRRGRRLQFVGVGLAVLLTALAVLLVFPILLLAPLVLLYVLFGAPSRRLARRAMRRYPALRESTTAVVSAEELVITIGDEATTREWSAISLVAEGARTFVLFIGPVEGRAFTLLAKRGLADADELPALRELLNAQVPSSR